MPLVGLKMLPRDNLIFNIGNLSGKLEDYERNATYVRRLVEESILINDGGQK
jgi:hypothetical protein